MAATESEAILRTEDDIDEAKLNELLAKKVHISKVHIHGLKRTKDDFAEKLARRLFETHTFGEFFDNASDVQSAFNNLGVTSGVKVLLDAGDTKKDLHIHLTLREKKWYAGGVQGIMGNNADTQMGLGGGVKVQAVLLNLMGRAERASCSWSKGTIDSSRELSFHKPIGALFSNILSGSVYSKSHDVTLSGYRSHNNGASISCSIPTDYGTHQFSWDGVWRQLIPSSDKTSFSVREQAGHSLKSSLRYDLMFDTRADPILPASGGYVKLSQELAGLGGDAHFYSKQISAQYNQSLILDNLVLQLGTSIGHIQPLSFLSPGDQPLSIMDKYFLGGPTSLRGFQNKGVGPRDRDDALGSDFYWLASAHLRAPLPGLSGGFVDRFRLQAFVNCGNTMDWSSAGSMDERIRQHRASARLSYGLGLVCNFLGAKFELNYCFPVHRQQQDKIQEGFQFGISLGE